MRYMMHAGTCAGTYTGAGNSGLTLGSGPTVITLQSLIPSPYGELNTIIDLAGGTRAFNLGTEPALSTLSGKPAVQ